MATYKVYAKKVIHYEALIEVPARGDAYRLADELITDDFTQVNTEFKLIDVCPVYGAEAAIVVTSA